MAELLDLLATSTGSLATMANAMLEEDFKSSHPDLTIWMERDGEEKSDKDDDNANRNPSSLGDRPTKRNSGEVRSVVIQEPPKRRRLDPSLTARRLVHEISTSAILGERMKVLQRAKEFLDHDFASGHDDEISAGIDVALAKHLVLLVLKISRCRSADNAWSSSQLVLVEDETMPALIEEVTLALECLEKAYLCSDMAVGESFRKVGPDLLHVLVTVIDEELSRRVVYESKPQKPGADGAPNNRQTPANTFKPIKEDGAEGSSSAEDGTGTDTQKPKEEGSINNDNAVNKEADGSSTPELQRAITPPTLKMGTPEGNYLILKATKVIGHLARVGQATKPMAFFPGLLSCMLNLINYQPHDAIPWEARLSALWILGNLACNPENMQMMMCTPGLVRSLVRVGCRALHPDDPMEVTMEVLRSRSLSSRALLNLSWKPENKIPLSENMALVELLAQLAVHRKAPALNQSKTVREILRQTRCHAVGGLRNLAAAPRRTKIQLCEYRNGHVLDALTDVALNDPDSDIQNRAFAAIHNLAVHDTAEKMVERPALVLALKDVLLEEQNQNNTAPNIPTTTKEGSPRSHASATLLVLERTITPDMNSYENLRDLLDAVNPTVPSDDEDEPITNRADVIEV